jgi:alkylated DNA repair protein alkB homolog 1
VGRIRRPTSLLRPWAHIPLQGLVILPSFVSAHTQRDLIKWSLRDHARHPNETNLDTHYLLPSSGLWNTYLHSPETIVQPRALPSPTSRVLPDSPGPRQLISNTPASPANFALLKSTSRPQPVPSAHAQPLSTAQLLPRLRWANIGWSYNWGAKQYDFAREVQPVGEPFRKVCVDVVRSICWRDVFEHLDAESLDGWGDGGPDWQTWEEMYGQYSNHPNFGPRLKGI